MELEEVENLASSVGKESESSGGSRTRRPSITEVSEGTAEVLIQFLESEDVADFTIPFSPDADVSDVKDIPDEWLEGLDLPEGCETLTVADLFGLDLSEYDYFGNPPRGQSDGDSDDPIDTEWKERGYKGNGNLIHDIKVAVNGNYCQEIQERLAEGYPEASEDNPEVIIAVTIPTKGDSLFDDMGEGIDLEYSRRQYARFYVQDADSTPERAIRYRQKAGQITEDEADQLVDSLDGDTEE